MHRSVPKYDDDNIGGVMCIYIEINRKMSSVKPNVRKKIKNKNYNDKII